MSSFLTGRIAARTAAVMAIVASLVVVVRPAGAQQRSDVSETTVVAGSTRTVEPSATRGFPVGQAVGPQPGPATAAPELRPDQAPERANRGMSRRPDSATDAQRAASAAGVGVPDVSPTPVTTSAPQVTQSFPGLDFFDQRFANGGNQFSIEPPARVCAWATAMSWRQ